MTDPLQSYFDSVRDAPFRWEDHHCGLFAAGAVDARKGTRLADKIRALGIASARQFRALQRSGKTLDAMVTELIGAPIADEPERGDVVLVRTVRGSTLGVAVPPLILCAGEQGIVPYPLGAACAVWRVS